MRRRRPAAPDQRCTLLAGVVGGSTEEAAELAQHPLVARCSARDGDALVTAFGRLASETSDPDAARGRLLQLVVDVEQRPLTEAAALLALSPQDAQELLDAARRQLGALRAAGRCRGWPLVAGPRTLTAPEQRAAAGHLEVCRGCRDHRAAIERAHRDALARAAAVTALVGAGQLAGLAAGGGLVSAGASSLLAGKAAAALVGVLGAAVVVGGGLTAIAQQQSGERRAPAVQAPAEVRPDSTPSPGAVSGCAAPCAVESPAPAAAVPPPVASPEAAVPVPPVLQLPAGGVVLVPPSAPAAPSLPATPSLPAVSPLPSLLPLPSDEPLPLVPRVP